MSEWWAVNEWMDECVRMCAPRQLRIQLHQRKMSGQTHQTNNSDLHKFLVIISQLHGKAIALPFSATQQCRDTVINLSYACQG